MHAIVDTLCTGPVAGIQPKLPRLQAAAIFHNSGTRHSVRGVADGLHRGDGSVRSASGQTDGETAGSSRTARAQHPAGSGSKKFTAEAVVAVAEAAAATTTDSAETATEPSRQSLLDGGTWRAFD